MTRNAKLLVGALPIAALAVLGAATVLGVELDRDRQHESMRREVEHIQELAVDAEANPPMRTSFLADAAIGDYPGKRVPTESESEFPIAPRQRRRRR